MSLRVLVTGSSDGVGRGIADALAARGAVVVRHARSEARADEVRAAVRADTGAEAQVLVGDLSSLAQTRALAAQVVALAEASEPFDAVVHNVGWSSRADHREVTEDGLETTFQVNAVGPYVLTALTPLPPRLVYIGSDSIRNGHLDLDDTQLEHGWEAGRAYSASKVALTALGLAVARHHPEIVCNVVHPGWISTKMSDYAAPLTVEQGADTPAWLALGEDPGSLETGRVLYQRQEQHYNAQSEDVAVQEALLAELARLTGVSLP